MPCSLTKSLRHHKPGAGLIGCLGIELFGHLNTVWPQTLRRKSETEAFTVLPIRMSASIEMTYPGKRDFSSKP
jgi:hypothetical protein